MKIIAVILLSALIIFLGTQIYSFLSKEKTAQADFASMQSELDAAKADEAQSQADLTYYLNPANLEKELRARFNFRAPGEHLMILVPDSSSTATSTP